MSLRLVILKESPGGDSVDDTHDDMASSLTTSTPSLVKDDSHPHVRLAVEAQGVLLVGRLRCHF